MKHARADYNRIQDPINKIPDDEPVFLLRGQDVAAPAAIAAWIASAKQHGANPDILESARYHLGVMMEYQQDHKKVPDLIVNRDMMKQAVAREPFAVALGKLISNYNLDVEDNLTAAVVADYLVKCMKALHQAYQDRNLKPCTASEGSKYPHP